MEQRPPDAQAAHCAATVAQLKGRLARLLDAYEHGCLEQTTFLERTARIRERLAREEATQQKYQDAQRTAAELRLIVDHLNSFAAQVTDGLASADFATKRKLLPINSSGGHVANAIVPPGFSTRSISAIATLGRGANI